MALRQPRRQLFERTSLCPTSRFARAYAPPWQQKKNIAAAQTRAPPVTQDATSSKGPTAIVFMNMGGPSTTDEVGDFLSRLFVCTEQPVTACISNH